MNGQSDNLNDQKQAFNCVSNDLVLKLIEQNNQLIIQNNQLIQINNEQNAQINELFEHLDLESDVPKSGYLDG